MKRQAGSTVISRFSRTRADGNKRCWRLEAGGKPPSKHSCNTTPSDHRSQDVVCGLFRKTSGAAYLDASSFAELGSAESAFTDLLHQCVATTGDHSDRIRNFGHFGVRIPFYFSLPFGEFPFARPGFFRRKPPKKSGPPHFGTSSLVGVLPGSRWREKGGKFRW